MKSRRHDNLLSRLKRIARSPVRLDGLRVLVVDDQADARRMLAKVLEGVGARVTTVGNVADALAA